MQYIEIRITVISAKSFNFLATYYKTHELPNANPNPSVHHYTLQPAEQILCNLPTQK